MFLFVAEVVIHLKSGINSNMAEITVKTEEGSITRVYEEEALLNNQIDVQKEVESMVDVLINSDTNFF